ncbi:MAG: hypothetical protein AAF266_06945 [Planctomycetota bacterium]
MNDALPSSLVRIFVALAVAVAPTLTVAETASAPKQPLAVDVELQPEGLLIGQLVNASGAPTENEAIRLVLKDGREAETKTNADGGFAFRGVSGVAQLQSKKANVVVRGWKRGTAPPNATPALLMVENDGVARGQHYAGQNAQQFFGRGKKLLANPLFVAGVVTTAVAVPVAIANDDDDDPAS